MYEGQDGIYRIRTNAAYSNFVVVKNGNKQAKTIKEYRISSLDNL